ncbi:uncharacterized protein H6S33_003063 [Morchella sextelata]|jgi:hypothetical protein|uniref:uncharacterized protein n=1 Tax=Morchella sextelata TaxID=1174677 RepID=UPI001D03BB19|nr:uncharacterized protein H6S33_003063 [Morchella sextelata]KAH0607075.1 hypothetical protein H6S33_003063 [Morchella sextelata]
MRFSAIAVSAAVFGVAMAVPAVVYETEVVTITSCAPEKTNCPARATATSAEVVPTVAPVESVPVYTSAPVASSPAVEPVASVPAAGSSAPVESVTIPASSAIAAVETPAVSSPAVGTGSVSAPAAVPTSATGTVKAHESIPPVPLSTGVYSWTPSASAGLPSAALNTSTPVVPSSPSASAVQDTFEGAAAAKGFSFAAVALAAAAYVLV